MENKQQFTEQEVYEISLDAFKQVHKLAYFLLHMALKSVLKRLPECQTAHCGRGKSHFIFGGLASPIVPYRNLTQTTDGITADCRSLV